MKKLIMCVLLMLSASILLVGCGEKKVTCTIETTEDDAITTETVTGTFKSNIIKKIETKAIIELKGEYAEQLDTLYPKLEEQYKSISEKGVNVSTKRDGNKVTINITMEPSKMSKESGLTVDDDATSEKFIETYKEMGYKCK